MFSIGSKNFIPQIQAIHSLVSEWVQAPENERDLLWRKILETISPLVYGFPRFRFGENEDTCSEFYLFALDFIPQILEYSVRKESGFPFYFAKSLRTLYYKFCRKEKKKSQEKVRMNYEHEILSHGPWTNSGSEGWDNFLHQRMEKKISTDEGYGALETTAENNKISEILHGILCSMPIKQRSIIKLQFGLQLGQDEIKNLTGGNGALKLPIILESQRQLHQNYMKERIQRDAHLKEINSLMVKESHAPLCQRDKSKLKNLKQKILKLEKGLSVRELSQITGITKSSIQRLMDNVREKIYQGLSPFILSGKEFQDMTQ